MILRKLYCTIVFSRIYHESTLKSPFFQKVKVFHMDFCKQMYVSKVSISLHSWEYLRYKSMHWYNNWVSILLQTFQLFLVISNFYILFFGKVSSISWKMWGKNIKILLLGKNRIKKQNNNARSLKKSRSQTVNLFNRLWSICVTCMKSLVLNILFFSQSPKTWFSCRPYKEICDTKLKKRKKERK